MSKRDLTGVRFGKLVALADTGKRTVHGKNSIWLCRCDCGKCVEIRSTNLTNSKRPQQSCGCSKSETISQKLTVHGGSKERLYKVWMSMRRRCYDKKTKGYQNYGGRGIKVCDEWKDYSLFREWSMKNGYDPLAEYQKCTLDRINGDGNYEPSNCRWVDIKTQENNRRNNRMIEYNGKTQNISQWAQELGIDCGLLRDRLRRGWSFEKSITHPKQIQNRFPTVKAV